MALTVEVLIPEKRTETALILLESFAATAAETDEVKITCEYQGGSDWLVMYGIGRAPRSDWRDTQLAAGGRVLVWDLGYVGRQKLTGYMRMSIDEDHPRLSLVDATAPDPSRWNVHKIALREDFDPDGHIVLVGLGRKSRAYIHEPLWEAWALESVRLRYPERRVVYRPKPDGKNQFPILDGVEVNTRSSIEEVLRGASLVVCRHSNVAVDAAIAGVPFEAYGGIALWLKSRAFTPVTRLDFLRRLAWWQWRASEAGDAWHFAKEIVCH